jgi:hypothetical protein
VSRVQTGGDHEADLTYLARQRTLSRVAFPPRARKQLSLRARRDRRIATDKTSRKIHNDITHVVIGTPRGFVGEVKGGGPIGVGSRLRGGCREMKTARHHFKWMFAGLGYSRSRKRQTPNKGYEQE